MIKTKKQMFTVIGAFVLVMMLMTVTYAFFNYTRTGVANRIQVGRIYFNTLQNGNINLTNMFPIEATPANLSDNTKVGMVTIDITGDTTYDNGVEYLVSAVDVNNTINSKSLPISINVSYGEASDEEVGLEDEEYFDNRGGNSSLYKVLAKDTISNNDQLIVGYIAKGSTGIDGTITIKAYLDKSKILISDTYLSGNVTHTEASGETSIEVVDYTNGTPNSMAEDKTVFTTTEWNQLQANGVSFKVKVEANEGTWVEEEVSVNALNERFFIDYNDVFGSSGNRSELSKKIKKVYFNKMGPTRMQNAYNAATVKIDLTKNNEGKVLAWLEENEDDDTKYNLIIASDGETYISQSPSMFQGFISLEEVLFNNINTSRLTFMSSMFTNCSSLKSVDLSMFDVSNITNYGGFERLFYNCTSLKEVDLSGWVINSYTTEHWFDGCTNLEKIYVSSSINFDNVLYSSGMFNGCTSLVGGQGTSYNGNNPTDKTYAHVDGGQTNPGYFTLKTN